MSSITCRVADFSILHIYFIPSQISRIPSQLSIVFHCRKQQLTAITYSTEMIVLKLLKTTVTNPTKSTLHTL